ncbi:hypothetical protein [Aquimarina macrocephali]|uniref:hypothetical protein n=1 Tax=Aquimarina macrocephali TaxID=666563 RepID=UPI0004BB3293|nr:hypothetical protein [Aquimarina macrocephali]
MLILKKAYGYCPGVALISNHIVYIENRNGNSNPRTLQNQTITRMFDLLDIHNIKIHAFRVDSGSYLYSVVHIASKRGKIFLYKSSYEFRS